MRCHGVGLGSAVALGVSALGVSALAVTAAAAAQPASQQVVLPGPVPYPTDNPPLLGRTPLPPAYLGPLLHIASTDHVLVGVGPDGRPVKVVAHQRLLVRGKGDYQLAISAPVEDVRAATGSDSEPGLRADQVLWAGFSPGRKVLAAEVTLRPRPAGKYLPVHLRLRRDGDRVTLTVINTTPTGESLYAGTTRAAELASLLDATRRESLAGRRLTAAYATFVGLVRVPKRKAPIEAPLLVQGELRLPGQAPVPFSRTVGDGHPLGFRVEARGGGTPHVHLLARPVPVIRLLRPPGAATWTESIRRRPRSAPFLLRRLLESRMRLVRADQYQSFLSDPDADGRSRSVYEYETVAASAVPRVAPAPSHDNGGTSALLVVAIALGSLALAGGGLVVWAHS
jgi:hypothetical protein